jgi:hypothetical protein
MPKGTPLTVSEQEGRLENLEQLLGAHFGKVTPSDLEFLQGIPTQTANTAYRNLISFGIKPGRISSQATLLGSDSETLQRNYKFLIKLGIKPEKMSTCTVLLTKSRETLKKNYNFLMKLGIKPEKISTCAVLLSINKETLLRNFEFLNKELGIKPEHISSQAQLLTSNPETLQRKFKFLVKFGINPEEIARQPQLLAVTLKTIQSHWQNLRRYFDADTIRTKAFVFLGLSLSTVDGNAQFLADHSVDTHKYFFYGSSPALKRKKMAWIARNVFNAHMLEGYERQEALSKVKRLVSMRPNQTLRPSIKQLDRDIAKLKKMAGRI